MRLKQLIKSCRLSQSGLRRDFEVSGITSDSRQVRKGFIFVAVKGKDFDGHDFIRQAIEKGAGAVIGSAQNPPLDSARGRQPIARKNIIYIRVRDTRRVLAELLARFYNQPSQGLKIVGITGTNGKTTVSYLIEAILKSAGFNPAVIGTINYRFKNQEFPAGNTTPGPEQLQPLLSRMHKERVDYLVMEVSSHALDQARVEAISFSAAIFTNLTQDHLDYHGDLKAYFTAKSRLFKGLSKQGLVILNADDAYAGQLIKLTKAQPVTYGLLSRQADIIAADLNFSLKGTDFILQLSPSFRKRFSLNTEGLNLSTALIGRYNIYNILAAASFALTQNIEPAVIQQAIKEFSGVPGRMERIAGAADFSVFIDYAHTEDALRNAISSLRPLCTGRLCVVFGCGGSRDKTKRPAMGRVVSELADKAIITTDNPRRENPQDIIDDIIAGTGKQNFKVIVERRQAIKQALSEAGRDDIILIAGKGHENYQVFKDKRIHFDDREVARQCLGLGRTGV